MLLEDPPSPASVTHPIDQGPMVVRESGGRSEAQELNMQSGNGMALEQAWILKTNSVSNFPHFCGKISKKGNLKNWWEHTV